MVGGGALVGPCVGVTVERRCWNVFGVLIDGLMALGAALCRAAVLAMRRFIQRVKAGQAGCMGLSGPAPVAVCVLLMFVLDSVGLRDAVYGLGEALARIQACQFLKGVQMVVCGRRM